MKTARIQIYKDGSNEYRWRLVSRNSRTIADSGEGYARRKGIANALEYLPLYPIEDNTGMMTERFTNIEHWY